MNKDELKRAVRALGDEFGVDPVAFAEKWVAYFPPPTTNGNGHSNGNTPSGAAAKGIRCQLVGPVTEEPPTSWFAKPHYPRGHLVLLEGPEGSGKGYHAAWIVFQVVSGAWGPPAPAIWLSSEEEKKEIALRMAALGYDPAKHAPIHYIEKQQGDALLTLPADKPEIIEVIQATGAAVVVVDVLRDHCAPTPEMGIKQRSNSDETWIRPAARAWQKVATTTDAMVVGFHHQNKGDGTARQKSTGSGGWRHEARTVLVMAEVNGSRAWALDKTNLAAKDTTVRSYEVIGVEVPVPNSTVVHESARFVPGGVEAGHCDIDQWVAAKKAVVYVIADPPEDVLAAWCREHLKPGDPLPAELALRADKSLGLSQRAIADARKALQASGLLWKEGNRLRWKGTQ